MSLDGTFSVIQAEIDGRLLVAMIDMGLRELPARQGLSFFLGLSTSLINPTSEGLPTRSDTDNLNVWEGVVEARLQAVTKLVFVGRVTWNGRRELLYYMGKEQPTVARHSMPYPVHAHLPSHVNVTRIGRRSTTG